ncbi:hypothetical protein [Streptomyces graminilatus]|nr:hypothetical protein [Streptomyces graminilatus]
MCGIPLRWQDGLAHRITLLGSRRNTSASAGLTRPYDLRHAGISF